MGNFATGLKSSTSETLFSENANPCDNQMSHCNYKTANIVRVELRLLCTPLLVALSRAACDKRERECSAFESSTCPAHSFRYSEFGTKASSKELNGLSGNVSLDDILLVKHSELE